MTRSAEVVLSAPAPTGPAPMRPEVGAVSLDVLDVPPAPVPARPPKLAAACVPAFPDVNPKRFCSLVYLAPRPSSVWVRRGKSCGLTGC